MMLFDTIKGVKGFKDRIIFPLQINFYYLKLSMIINEKVLNNPRLKNISPVIIIAIYC